MAWQALESEVMSIDAALSTKYSITRTCHCCAPVIAKP